MPALALLIDKAQLLRHTQTGLAVPAGGLQVHGADAWVEKQWVLAERPGSPTDDFFVILLEMGTEREQLSPCGNAFASLDRATLPPKWSGIRVDLVFRSNSIFRVRAEGWA